MTSHSFLLSRVCYMPDLMGDSPMGFAQPLPMRPNLQAEKKRAKQLLKLLKAGDTSVLGRAVELLPRCSGLSVDEAKGIVFKLSDAQLMIARQYGFSSWPKLRAHIESLEGKAVPRCKPFRKEISYYEDRAAGMLSMIQAGHERELLLVAHHHPDYQGQSVETLGAVDWALEDMRLVHAKEHGFETWEELVAHVEALSNGERKEAFMQAFDALEARDLARLESALTEDPSILNALGTNGNTLLNLAVALCERGDLSREPAVGEEDADIRLSLVEYLLEQGADPDLGNNKGMTPLHEAAYFGYVKAIDRLLDAGASLELESHGSGGTPLVMSLFWGHRKAADHLAQFGVYPKNLRVAAGLGRLDVIKECFDSGQLTEQAKSSLGFYRPHSGFALWKRKHTDQEVLDEALTYAARNGRDEVLNELIELGADVNGEPYRGTALVWAGHRDRVETMTRLIELGADPQQVCSFGGEQDLTPLHIAAWAGSRGACDLLLSHGADPRIKDATHDGTPYGWAAYNGHRELGIYLATIAAEQWGDAEARAALDRIS